MIHLIIVLCLIVIDLAIFVGFLLHILLRKQGSSETRLTWIVLLILVPYLGALLYLLVGAPRFGRHRRRLHRPRWQPGNLHLRLDRRWHHPHRLHLDHHPFRGMKRDHSQE